MRSTTDPGAASAPGPGGELPGAPAVASTPSPAGARGRFWGRLVRGPLWPLVWTAMLLQLSVLGAMSLGWNALALVLHPLLPRRRGTRLGRAAIAWIYRTFWSLARTVGMLRLDDAVLDALRDEPGGLVLVANHPSMLDAMLIAARLPRGLCIMKASLTRNPFLGPGARLARYIGNDSPRRMIQDAVAELREGGQLILFPEGTRTVQPPLNPVHDGFAVIAQRARVPVQTVFIDTDSRYGGKGWPLWRLPPLPLRFALRLGPRFEPGRDARALAREVEACLRAGVQARPPQPRP